MHQSYGHVCFTLLALGCTAELQPSPEASTPSATAPAAGGATSTEVTPAPLPPSGVATPAAEPALPSLRGVLDCPALPAPSYGAARTDLPLSTSFSTSCAVCHGSRGEGVAGKYPTIPGKLDEAAFIARVRMGGLNMPPFGPDLVSDDDIRRDFAALTKRPAGVSETGLPQDGEWSWTDAQVDQAYKAGLTMWRKADSHGAACVNCHTPDAVDLAVIAYPDDAIVRRATKHISASEARVVVDFVHAQRRRFNVHNACDPAVWRPFQPGGQVLPGNTAEERDDALGEHLRGLGLKVTSGAIESPADARAAIDELITLDIRRKLRVGIALPHWTDDGFNGDEHRNLNDWITEAPPLPSSPENRAELFRLHDQYLASPNLQNLQAIDAFMLSHSRTSADFDPTFKSGTPMDLWYNITFSAKPRAALVASHYFRLAALGQPSLFDEGPMPLARTDRLWNPPFYIGMKSAENSCFSDTFCNSLAPLPEPMREDVPAGMEMSELSHVMSHPWFIVGWMFDHSFMNGENLGVGGEAHTQHYWQPHFTDEAVFHQTFIMTLKFLHQQAAFERGRGNGTVPMTNDVAPPEQSDPALDSYWLQLQGLAGGEAGGNLPLNPKNASTAIQLHINLLRAILYHQIELIGQGRKIAGRAGLLQTLGGWKGFASHFVTSAFERPDLQPALAELQGRKAYFTTDTAALVDQAIQLVQTTEDVAPPGHNQGRGVF